MGAGYMQTGYYVGIIVGALLNATVGAAYGWRAMFADRRTPALLVLFIQNGVHEPKRWKPVAQKLAPLEMIFSPEYFRRTMLNALYLFVSIVGLWAGSVYVPSSVTFLALNAGSTPAQAARIASYATVLLSFSTVLGCLALPPFAERFGRRVTLGFYFLLMFLSISVGFGYAYYLKQCAGVVHRDALCAGLRGREFHDVLAVAAGAVSHRMPGQRVRLRHFGGPIRRRGRDVPGGLGRQPRWGPSVRPSR